MQYRNTDGIAIYSVDRRWPLMLSAKEPAMFMEHIGSDYLETVAPVTRAQIDRIAGDDGVIYNLFVPLAVA